jgi:hypothetical protein
MQGAQQRPGHSPMHLVVFGPVQAYAPQSPQGSPGLPGVTGPQPPQQFFPGSLTHATLFGPLHT